MTMGAPGDGDGTDDGGNDEVGDEVDEGKDDVYIQRRKMIFFNCSNRFFNEIGEKI